MSVNTISSAVASYVQKVTGGQASGARSSSGVSAAMQEATETAAATRQEAAKGDQQAIRKLARMTLDHQA
jgi:hypothetical protein